MNYFKNSMAAILSGFGLFTFAAVWLFAIASFFVALIHDVRAGDWLWTVIDVVLSPVGIVRGALIMFGAL